MHSLNREIILNITHENGTISRAQLSRLSGISMPAVNNIVDKLVREQIIEEIGKGESSGGRRPTLLRYNNDFGRVVGVDLGSDKIKIAVADLAGHILTLEEKSIWSWDDNSKLEKLIEGIKEVLQKYHKYDQHRCTLGVGVPGIVDPESGRVSCAPLFPSWEDFPLQEVLQDKLNITTYIDNDVNTASWGEYIFGAAKEVENSLFVLVSHGIGSAHIRNGEIYRGATNAAGEIGHTLVERSNLYMQCADKGCLESLISTSILLSKAKNAVKKGESKLLKELCGGNIDALNTDMVCQAAIQNDSSALAIVEEVREYLAVAIANAISIINPDMVVIGGNIAGFPYVEELFLEHIKTLIKPHIPHYPEITISALTTNAVLYGAIVLALDLMHSKFVAITS